MNEFSTYEFVVSQRIEGKWLAARIGLVLFYVLYVVGLLLLAFRTRLLVPLLALIPITLWILVFFTWRYTVVDYEYSITSGELSFSKIYGNRTRRQKLVLKLRDAVCIAPLEEGEHFKRAEAWHPQREFTAFSSLAAPDIYYILFEYAYKDGKKRKKCRAIFYFEATARALQICRFYNPSATVMKKVSR